MNNIEELSNKFLAKQALEQLKLDGKVAKWAVKWNSEELKRIVILTIYDEIQRTRTNSELKELSNKEVSSQLVEMADTIHQLEKDIYVINRSILSLNTEDMVNNAMDAYFGNIPEEKIKLLEDIETIVNELEVVK